MNVLDGCCQVQQSHNELNITISQNVKRAETVGFLGKIKYKTKIHFIKSLQWLAMYVCIHTVKHLAMHILSQTPIVTTEVMRIDFYEIVLPCEKSEN